MRTRRFETDQSYGSIKCSSEPALETHRHSTSLTLQGKKQTKTYTHTQTVRSFPTDVQIWGSSNKSLDIFETDIRGIRGGGGCWCINLTTTRTSISHAYTPIININLNEIYTTLFSSLIWSICQKKGWCPAFLHLSSEVHFRTRNPIRKIVRKGFFFF